MRRRQFIASAGATLAAAPALAAPLLSSSAVVAWDLEADVVVVGAGAAGICAAIEARAAGASVIVLESLPRAGGTSAISGGVIYAGGGTYVQRALGVHDSPAAMLKALSSAGPPGLPLDRARAYCDGSVEHLVWLKALGVPFPDQPLAGETLLVDPLEPAVARCHRPEAPEGLAGQVLMNSLLARARDRGVQLITGASAQRLVAQGDGRILGLAMNAGGARSHVRARRGLVLACGGFIRQREMVGMFAPQLAACATPWGAAHDLGQGIRLGISAGAATLRMAEGYAGLDLAALAPAPSGLLVNAAGQRFIAEDAYAGALGHAVTYEQRGAAWLITDAQAHPPAAQQDFPRVAEAVSIGQLSDELGMPRGALQQTVAYYNRYAARGEDPQFNKTRAYLRPFQGPPYRAWLVSGPRAVFPAYTLGGLATDLGGAVLDGFGEPIAGLFAAGRTAASLPAAPLLTEGLSLGDATFFGRRAGRSAAGRG